ncbi:hypothetical protein NMY22_g11362 [Coprinellus aureogranulatus]|nr:hypothetical protein NMY22_g11362 [Coprinellus aureogranulatus]
MTASLCSRKWEHDLPGELWSLEIVHNLDPLDVWHLCRTCKNLRALLSEKAVWIDILQSQCQRLGLFAQSYPLEDMDALEIQRACLAPYRWDNLIRRHAVPLGGLDDAPRLPVLAFKSPMSLRSFTYAGHLVPGGRFFVSLNDVGDSSTGVALSLWDFGLPGRQARTSEPILLCRTVVKLVRPSYTYRWDMMVTFDGDGVLRVALSQAGEETMIRVMSIDPNDALTGFEELASAVFADHPAWRMSFRRDFLLLRNIGEFFLLWDYVNSRFTKWTIQSAVNNVDEVVLTNGHILHFGDECVSIWSLSSVTALENTVLRPERFESRSLLPHQDLSPDWTTLYPGRPPDNGDVERFVAPVYSSFGRSSSVTFDLFSLPQPSSRDYTPAAFVRFTIDIDATCSALSPPFSIQKVSAGYLPPRFFLRPNRARLVERRIEMNSIDVPCITGKMSITASERRDTTFIYGPNSPAKEEGSDGEGGSAEHRAHFQGVLVTPLEPYRPVASCAASGRFLFDKWSEEERTGLAFVVDYI